MSSEKTRKRIKLIRESLGWSREELAKKLNTTPQIVANIELGRKQIYADDMWDLVKAFGMTMSQFYSDEIKLNKEVSIEETNLIDTFRSFSENGQKLVISIIDSIKEYENNKTATIIPFIQQKLPKTKEMPYYDQAAGMGSGQYIDDVVPDKIILLERVIPPKADFIIRVVGDSMEPVYHEGELLFIEKTEELNIGDIGLFNYEGEQMVKELGEGVLISHNKVYQPIKINGELYVQGRVLGKV